MSTAIVELEDQHLARLLRRARAHNEAAAITGILVYGAGRFLQVLEGPTEAVRHLYQRILTDPRHGHFELLADGPAPRREFAGWHMSFGLTADPKFDPKAGHLPTELPGYFTPDQAAEAARAEAPVWQVLREFLVATGQQAGGEVR